MLFPSPGDLSYLGLEPGSPALQADSLLTELQGNSIYIYIYIYRERERERERERDRFITAIDLCGYGSQKPHSLGLLQAGEPGKPVV